MAEKIRVAVVGVSIGKRHILAYQSLSDQFEVVAICDIDAAKARAVADELQIPQVVSDLATLCARDDVEVIDLCTPSYLHYAQTQSVLCAGKHVICEKPVAGSLQQVDALIELEAQTGRRVMPIFQYRCGRGAQKLKHLVDEGIAGRAYLTTVETCWRRKTEYYAVPWRGKWETELGGSIVTLAVHAHDVVYYLLGPARSVFARTKTLVNPIETEDCVSASLEMADGSLCSLSVTTGSPKQISRQRYCFSHLVAESNIEPYRNTEDPWSFIGDSPEIDQQIAAALANCPELPQGFPGQFYRYAKAMRDGAELPVTLADARASLELITAIYHSAETNQVVELPLGKDHPKYAGWRPARLDTTRKVP